MSLEVRAKLDYGSRPELQVGLFLVAKSTFLLFQFFVRVARSTVSVRGLIYRVVVLVL